MGRVEGLDAKVLLRGDPEDPNGPFWPLGMHSVVGLVDNAYRIMQGAAVEDKPVGFYITGREAEKAARRLYQLMNLEQISQKEIDELAERFGVQ